MGPRRSVSSSRAHLQQHCSPQRLFRAHHSKQRPMFLDWWSSTSHAARQIDLICERQPGTGGWLLESPEFQAWVKKPRATLFCPGAPGAGKTILASIVIDELEKRHETNCDVGIAYFFCSFQCQSGDQEPEILLASILRQLCQVMSQFQTMLCRCTRSTSPREHGRRLTRFPRLYGLS